MTAISPHTTKQIIKVAVPTPLRRTFDYIAPQAGDIVAPGTRVMVPFGKRTLCGVVIQVCNESAIKELKYAIEVLDQKPLYSPKMLELFNWASHYYHYPIGMMYAASIPPYLRKNKNLTLPQSKNTTAICAPPELNIEQKSAVEEVAANLHSFATYLLDGVTGSGKTEVYMQLIARTIEAGKQALILVPEINLTPQTLQRFESRFAVPIAVLHSQISEKKRAIYWMQAQSGIAPIVIGTRLAALTPLANPGLLIIDEEHDLSFKQQDSFRYSARDLIIKRGQLENCPVILGTATPSLESWHNLKQQRYTHLCLTKRAGQAVPPNIEVVDVRHKKLEAGLSNHLINAIKLRLEHKEQVLIFINRRGYAPVAMCFNCGWHQVCERCDSNMIYHASCKQLRCHHCTSQIQLPKTCPNCKAEINLLGVGTQRIEECIKDHFPKAKIARVDKDTAGTKNKLQNILDEVHNGKIDILIGTQMLAKGHHFPNLTLVAVVDIDQALYSADFRALERLGQQLTQVSGRTGRESKQGQVILQTTQPDHPILNLILFENYHSFLDRIYTERCQALLPPFNAQVLIRAETKKPNQAQNFLLATKKLLANFGKNRIESFGPIPAPMEKRQGFYRAQLLLQAPTRKELQLAIQQTITKLEKEKISQSVRWTIDVDPLELY